MQLTGKVVLLMLFSLQTPVFADVPNEAAQEFEIGYTSVLAARNALLSNGNIAVSVENGWTIAGDRDNYTMWSFAPPGDPAYPSVVKRIIVQGHGGLDIKMSVLCEAPKSACKQLVENFKVLNERMRESLKRH
jgi:hypothetical protein